MSETPLVPANSAPKQDAGSGDGTWSDWWLWDSFDNPSSLPPSPQIGWRGRACLQVKNWVSDSVQTLQNLAAKIFRGLKEIWNETRQVSGCLLDHHWRHLSPGVEFTESSESNPELQSLVSDLKRRIKEGIEPFLPDNGIGGSYIFENLGIFKPSDEEAYSPANPKGRLGELGEARIRTGIRTGSGAAAECAAYSLDHEGFSGVPPTVQVSLTHSMLFHPEEGYRHQFRRLKTKVGSLQRLVENEGSVRQLSRSQLSQVPAREIHKIGILDIRFFNSDRHQDNMLVQKSGNTWRLVPIDHGMCFPENGEQAKFVWMRYPQADKPFDADTLAYIERLDPDKDARILREKFRMDEARIQVVHWATTLLKKGAEQGWTLRDIAGLLHRSRLGDLLDKEELRSVTREMVDMAVGMNNIEKMLPPLAHPEQLKDLISKAWLEEETEEQILKQLSRLTVKSDFESLIEQAKEETFYEPDCLHGRMLELIDELIEICLEGQEEAEGEPVSTVALAKAQACDPNLPLASPLGG